MNICVLQAIDVILNWILHMEMERVDGHQTFEGQFCSTINQTSQVFIQCSQCLFKLLFLSFLHALSLSLSLSLSHAHAWICKLGTVFPHPLEAFERGESYYPHCVYNTRSVPFQTKLWNQEFKFSFGSKIYPLQFWITVYVCVCKRERDKERKPY